MALKPIKEVEESFDKLLSPFEEFVESQTSTGWVLMGATVLTMLVVNSGLNEIYEQFIHEEAGLVLGQGQFTMPLAEWVGSGLMALFFFLLGLELKRECLAGELREPRRFVIVLFAALGGMLVPAALYLLLNYDTPFQSGWAIPMATDAAFALGVLAFFKKRLSKEVFVFLTGLAIFDDLGAILIIAFYYSGTLDFAALAWAGLIVFLLATLNITGFRNPAPYWILGLILWWYVHQSGIHATIAGVIVALTIPARPRQTPEKSVNKIRALLDSFEQRRKEQPSILSDQDQSEILLEAESLLEEASTPLQRWESKLEKVIGVVVLPVFAFTSAGIHFSKDMGWESFQSPLVIGVLLGLLVGKPLGIFLFGLAGIRLGFGDLPSGFGYKDLLGVGLVAGMGFTMSIFISLLSFEESPGVMEEAKLAILVSTLLAGLLGSVWFWLAGNRRETNQNAAA